MSTPTSLSAKDSSAPLNSPSRVIAASLAGTTVEFYDFYVYATAAALVFPKLFFPTGNDTTALIASFAVFGAAMVARPVGAILPELFPTNVRYTGSAIAYNVSSILGAALAPIIAVALWTKAGGSTWMVGVYLAVAAVLTLISLIIVRETKDIDYTATSHDEEALGFETDELLGTGV